MPAGPGYNNLSRDQRTCSTNGAVTGSDVVDGELYLQATFDYTRSHLWRSVCRISVVCNPLTRSRNLGILFAFVVFGCATYLIATEYISAKRSKGEVLLFRRGHVPKLSAPADEEAKSLDQVRSQDLTRQITVPATIQKQTAVFHWEGVNYDIKIKGEPRRLLDDVDGWVKPGTLTALMVRGRPIYSWEQLCALTF